MLPRAAHAGLVWGIALGLSSCAAQPEAKTQPPEVIYIELASDQPKSCSDGRPVLSGWVRENMLTPPDTEPAELSPLPQPQEFFDSKAENETKLRVAGFQASERAAALLNVLTAAREGNWCGGPK